MVFLNLVMFRIWETFPNFKIFLHVLLLYDRIQIVEERYLNENMFAHLRKLCKFPHLESHASDWTEELSEMWLHWPGHSREITLCDDHSRKVNYSSQFGLGNLSTEEAFSVLTRNITIALVFTYTAEPLTWDIRIYFLIPDKEIWELAYHFSSIIIFIWKTMKLLYVFVYLFLNTV